MKTQEEIEKRIKEMSEANDRYAKMMFNNEMSLQEYSMLNSLNTGLILELIWVLEEGE